MDKVLLFIVCGVVAFLTVSFFIVRIKAVMFAVGSVLGMRK